MKDSAALYHVQSFSNLTAGMLSRLADDLAGMHMAAPRNFVGNVVNFEHM